MKELTKKRMLTLIKIVGKNKLGHKIGLYKCECGNEKEVLVSNAVYGNTYSCGCYNKKIAKDNNTSHGMTNHPLYGRWSKIKDRCFNEKNPSYNRYGGRGITMCDEWKNDFKIFYEWCIKNGWEKELEIDRRENDEGYYPYNCRFVTPQVNSNNRRNNRLLSFNGETKTVAEWARYKRINVMTLLNRLHTNWSIEKALTTPVKIK